MRLLIVDDSQPMRRLLRKLLADLASITECDDGAAALTAYRGARPDWVLMDLKMQGTDGIAATREVKAAFPDARVVIVTCYDDAKLRAAARRAGACGYVLKDDLMTLRVLLGAEMQPAP